MIRNIHCKYIKILFIIYISLNDFKFMSYQKRKSILYDFIPYLDNEESIKLLGEYPYTITIGMSDFRYFFAEHVENCFSDFDHTFNNYITKQVWIEILSLLNKPIENYSCEYRAFVIEICQWIELKLDLANGILIFGNL